MMKKKKDKSYQIHKKNSIKDKVIEKLKQYLNDFKEKHPRKFDSKLDEWIYCREEGIGIEDINKIDKYKDIIGH